MYCAIFAYLTGAVFIPAPGVEFLFHTFDSFLICHFKHLSSSITFSAFFSPSALSLTVSSSRP